MRDREVRASEEQGVKAMRCGDEKERNQWILAQGS